MGRPAKNLIGQQFGNLIVLERAGNASDGHVLWKCECQCSEHKIVYKTSNQLQRKNSTPSCGCLVHELISQAAKNRYKDLTGQKFGLLTALEKINLDKPGIWWRCKCDCGNDQFITTAHHLKSGNTKSCGCLKSVGEYNIINALIKNNITFIREYSFKDFKYNDSQGVPRFDFFLPKLNRIIEYDGAQHYKECGDLWENNCPLEIRQKRDQEKNQYCKEHNILLVRIPYWERDNITLDMIIGDQYLVK